jgi:hypothetical protein
MLLAIATLLVACSGENVARSGSTSSGSSTTSNAATLAWDPVTNPVPSGYRVYFGLAPRSYSQAFGQGIAVGNVTTFTVMGLSNQTTYYFAVTAVDGSNNESVFSNEVLKTFP